MSQQQPIVLSSIHKDGTFEVLDGQPKSLRSKKMVFYEKTLFKLQYKSDGMQGFFTRGIKDYDNVLLLHVNRPTDGEERIFVFKSGPDPSSSPKILDLDQSITSWSTGMKLFLPDVRQVLLTRESIILLKTKTSLVGTISQN